MTTSRLRRRLGRWLVYVILTLFGLSFVGWPSPVLAAELTVGSKKFTESVVLGEVCCQLIERTGQTCEHRRELGGTRVVYAALMRGDIDVYVEYSGTLRREIFAKQAPADDAAVARLLAADGVGMSQPLGFNNTYALAMKRQRAQQLSLVRVSDLSQQPALKLRFSNEFMDRGDGWPALQRAYRMPHMDVRGLDHDLAYRALAAQQADVIDVYTTDAEIAHYGLMVLDDDKGHFPRYDALVLYRKQARQQHPAAFTQLLKVLEGGIDAPTMQRLNAQAKIERMPEQQVAASWLSQKLGQVQAPRIADSWVTKLWQHTREHLMLVGWSLLAAMLLGVPLGVLAARHRRLGPLLLGAIGVIQTVPSLALLVMMIPLLGIGATPAIVALFLYSLLPIVRNTHHGLTAIPPNLAEAAEALGLSSGAKLRHIELPLAAPAILAGMKTAAVINVGTATLGALIGAGGYGQPILTGIRLDDTSLIMQGAVPAAVLALLVQWLFAGIERLVVSRGLRLEAAEGPRAG